MSEVGTKAVNSELKEILQKALLNATFTVGVNKISCQA
jgi:hypothetical protein